MSAPWQASSRLPYNGCMDTVDLSTGIGGLTWGARPAEILALHPHARATHEVKQPASKNEPAVHISPALVIENFLPVPAGQIRAACGFDGARLVGIDLYPRTNFQDAVLRIFLQRGLHALLKRLGLPNTPELPERTQTLTEDLESNGTLIQLILKKTDYCVCLYAPETEELERHTPLHRAHRRIQAERGILQQRVFPGQWPEKQAPEDDADTPKKKKGWFGAG